MTGTTTDALAALHFELATAYPTYVGRRRPGRVSCTVTGQRGEYEAPHCPGPLELTAAVRIAAAAADERGVLDLYTHLAPVARLVRAAGWHTLSWEADSTDDVPTIVMTVTTLAAE